MGQHSPLFDFFLGKVGNQRYLLFFFFFFFTTYNLTQYNFDLSLIILNFSIFPNCFFSSQIYTSGGGRIKCSLTKWIPQNAFHHEDTKMASGVEIVTPSLLSEIPKPRSGHRCCSDEGNVYVFGGYSPHHHHELFQELWRFNISTRTWTLMPTTGPFPTEVASSCVILDKGNLIVFGGSGVPFGMCNSNKLHICSLKTLQWFDFSERFSEHAEDGREDVSPIAGYGQSMVLSCDKELYVFGGTTGLEFNSYLYRYSLHERKWDCLRSDNPPIPRYRHESVCDGERFYVIGGGMSSRDPNNFFQLDKIQSFDFKSKGWNEHVCYPSKYHGFPKRRRCHGCVLFKSSVFICGGYDGVSIFDDIWSLDLDTFQWEKLLKVSLLLRRPNELLSIIMPFTYNCGLVGSELVKLRLSSLFG